MKAGSTSGSDQILSCGFDTACMERRTINVSAAYFLSIEFQQTGGLVDGLYPPAMRAPKTPFRGVHADTATVAQDVIVGASDWAQRLAANKASVRATPGCSVQPFRLLTEV